jgi:hypothetical protein
MHLQVCGGEEKGENTHARSLTLPRQAGSEGGGVVWHGEVMGTGARRVRE